MLIMVVTSGLFALEVAGFVRPGRLARPQPEPILMPDGHPSFDRHVQWCLMREEPSELCNQFLSMVARYGEYGH